MENNKNILGIDMGGTNMRAGLVTEHKIKSITSRRVNGKGSMQKVLQDIFSLIDSLIDSYVTSIGVGVPGLVDVHGIVHDVVYIPSWKEVPLKQLMEERYHLPVLINNDANCFALGEFYFGKGKGVNTMIGLTIGTGLGSGIIINKKLYAGRNCGAGEFGMVDYLDKCYEYYASGQFFKNVYQLDGEIVFKLAAEGDSKALLMYEEMGMHLGNAVRMIMYTIDVELIILGGSVRHAWPYFSKTMWQQIKTFAYTRSVEHLKIEVSELENSGILGAAALHFDFI